MSVKQFKDNVGNIDAGWRGIAATTLASLLVVGTIAGLVALIVTLGWPGGIIAVVIVLTGLAYIGSRGEP